MIEDQNPILPELPDESPEPAHDPGPSEGDEQHFQLQEGMTPLLMPAVHVDPGATNRLPSLQERLLRPSPRLTFGHARDIGLMRATNEDSILALYTAQQNVQENPNLSLFVVADGAGGHADGEHASTVACRVVLEAASEGIYLPMLLQHVSPATAEPVPPITEVLVEAYRRADKKVRAEVPGGGTTLTTVLIIGDLAHIAHVGDSRAYLLTQEQDGPALHQITRDHSVAKRLQEIGQITAAEAAHHPEASRLWKIVGLSENLEPDINTRRLPAGCTLVLCSDGLWNMVSDADIATIVVSAPTPQDAANHLIAAANASGGLDNISVIVVHLP
jgi:serine/threonine protein phosphatase PrpC